MENIVTKCPAETLVSILCYLYYLLCHLLTKLNIHIFLKLCKWQFIFTEIYVRG